MALSFHTQASRISRKHCIAPYKKSQIFSMCWTSRTCWTDIQHMQRYVPAIYMSRKLLTYMMAELCRAPASSAGNLACMLSMTGMHSCARA